MNFLNDFLFLLPEIYVSFFSILILLFGTWLRNQSFNIFVINLGYVFVFCLIIVLCILYYTPLDFCALSYQYNSTFLISLIKIFFICILLLSVLVSLNYFFVEKIFFIEYYFFLGLLIISAFFLMSSNDFILFYFSLELQALILYTLAALKRFTAFSSESGLKYFVLGAFSSGLILFGFSLLYGFLGISNFFDLKFIFLK